MNFFGLIFRAADLILAGAQVVDKAADAVKKVARRLKSPTKPPEQRKPRGKDLVHIDRQIESATKNFRGGDTLPLPRPTQLRPPPLKR